MEREFSSFGGPPILIISYEEVRRWVGERLKERKLQPDLICVADARELVEIDATDSALELHTRGYYATLSAGRRWACRPRR